MLLFAMVQKVIEYISLRADFTSKILLFLTPSASVDALFYLANFN